MPDHDDFDQLLERSSLGAPKVRQARSRVAWTDMAAVHNKLVCPNTDRAPFPAPSRPKTDLYLVVDTREDEQIQGDDGCDLRMKDCHGQVYAVVVKSCKARGDDETPRDDAPADTTCGDGRTVQFVRQALMERLVRKEWSRRWSAQREDLNLIIVVPTSGGRRPQWVPSGSEGCLVCDNNIESENR